MILGALKAVEAEALNDIFGLISHPRANLPTVAEAKSSELSCLTASCEEIESVIGAFNSTNIDVVCLSPLTSPVGLELTTSATNG